MKIKYRKGRKIDHNKFVEVYRNLNGDKSSVWSIRQNGLVVAHATALTLARAMVRVSQAGALRVRKERRKNVHAVIRGYFKEVPQSEFSGVRPVSYNPYRVDNEGRSLFYYKDSKMTVNPESEHKAALLTRDGALFTT